MLAFHNRGNLGTKAYYQDGGCFNVFKLLGLELIDQVVEFLLQK